MVKLTTIPGVVFYVINVRTGRMLSFGAIETASQEIFGLHSTKVPTPLIIIKNSPDGAKIIELLTDKITKETIESYLSS